MPDRLSPVVEQQRADVSRCRRQIDQSGGPEAVVEIAVPLVTEQARQRATIAAGNAGVCPEAQLRHAGGNGNVVERADIVDREDRSGERIFRRSGSVDRVAEQTRSAVGRPVRVELRPAPDVLVFDDRPVGRMAGVETRCKLDIPIGLVAAQEGEIDAGVGRSLYVGELRLRPVFVVADIEVGVGIEQQCGIGRGIDAGDVADIVTVLLEPINRRVLLAKQEIRRAGRREPLNSSRSDDCS